MIDTDSARELAPYVAIFLVAVVFVMVLCLGILAFPYVRRLIPWKHSHCGEWNWLRQSCKRCIAEWEDKKKGRWARALEERELKPIGRFKSGRK